MDGQTLRSYRDSKKWNQHQLAKLLNVSQKTVSNWETGASPIPDSVTETSLAQLQGPQDGVQVSPGMHHRVARPAAPRDPIVPVVIPYPGESHAAILARWPRGFPGMRKTVWEGVVQLALTATYVEGSGMVLSPPQPERGWHAGRPHWCFDEHGPEWAQANVKRIRELQAEGLPQPAPQSSMKSVDTSAWHRRDGSPIDQAPADEIVHNSAGGQLPAAIALELLASHAEGRAPDYAQAQKDIEAAQAERTRPAPIPYEAWRAASGVLNLPSRR